MAREGCDLDLSKFRVEGVYVCGCGGLAFEGEPLGMDLWLVEHGPDVIPLVRAHGAAGLFFSCLEAVAAAELYEGHYRAAAAEVDDGAGEVEDDGLYGVHGFSFG